MRIIRKKCALISKQEGTVVFFPWLLADNIAALKIIAIQRLMVVSAVSSSEQKRNTTMNASKLQSAKHLSPSLKANILHYFINERQVTTVIFLKRRSI